MCSVVVWITGPVQFIPMFKDQLYSKEEFVGDVRDVDLIPGLGRSPTQEEEMATHSSILAWEIPWKEKPSKLSGVTRVRHDLVTKQ